MNELAGVPGSIPALSKKTKISKKDIIQLSVVQAKEKLRLIQSDMDEKVNKLAKEREELNKKLVLDSIEFVTKNVEDFDAVKRFVSREKESDFAVIVEGFELQEPAKDELLIIWAIKIKMGGYQTFTSKKKTKGSKTLLKQYMVILSMYDEITSCKKALDITKRKIADLPELEASLNANLTKLQLEGSIAGRDLLTRMQEHVDSIIG